MIPRNIFPIYTAPKFLVAALMLAMAALSPSAAFAQQQLPSNLQVVGTISGTGNVVPEVNDIVQVVLVSRLSSVEAQGTVLAPDGTFLVDMSETQNFNGTQLTALLKKGNTVYQLNNGSTPLAFPYSGTFPFPSRISFALAIGTRISGGGSSGGGGGAPGGVKNDQYDVNEDGVFDQADVDAAKKQLGQTGTSAKFDVNEDGMFTTRDVVDMIKAMNGDGPSRLVPVPAATTTTTTTTP